MNEATHGATTLGTEQSPVKAPVAFISYSHDTREHKAWVAALAHRLVDKGVNVLFDQWDLGPGDDVPKFMEKAVNSADRVLMVCTETYVRKADDGKGGVGYEAMVVTGELVRNLGTNKFVPIVRQKTAPVALPRCVSTRFYVDLSDGAEAGDNFELLLRELHNAPKLPKPALGANPFVVNEFIGTQKQADIAERRLEFAGSLATPEMAYLRALEIIHADDRVAWRKLLLAAGERGATSLKLWRLQNDAVPKANSEDFTVLEAHARTGVECYASLIACLVAAAETGKSGFSDQLGWVDSIISPSGHEKTGAVYHTSFPQLVFFITQALVGGMLMFSETGEAAYALSTVKLADQSSPSEVRPLFELSSFTGWPKSAGKNCTAAWDFLDSIITSWAWLKSAFGNEQECRAGVTAYYQLLLFLNFVKLAKGGEFENDVRIIKSLSVSAPLCFSIWPAMVVNKGYSYFLRQNILLKRILDDNGIGDSAFETSWRLWMLRVGEWLGNVYPGCRLEILIPNSNFPEHLKKHRLAID
jgi:hypothetical protein